MISWLLELGLSLGLSCLCRLASPLDLAMDFLVHLFEVRILQ